MKVMLLTAVLLTSCAAQPEPPGNSAPVDSTNEKIFAATMARARNERVDTLPIGDVMAEVGSWFVGRPYTPGTLEADGAEHLVINLREFDCVTFVESVLAMARLIRSGRADYNSFRNELQRIRYRSGELNEYPSRLHYFSEWISDNEAKGIVSNRTRELGGVLDREPIAFMTQHRKSYRQLADERYFASIREMESRLTGQPRWMVSEGRIDEIASGIRNGDVIAATSSVKGLDVAHTGIAVWVSGKLHLMHAPLVGDSVEISEKPLAERIVSIERQDGIMIARPQEPR